VGTPLPQPNAGLTLIPPTIGPSPTIDYVTPGALVSAACVGEKSTGKIPQSPFDVYPSLIQDFLNSGATVSELDQALYDLGIASLPTSNAEADLTGDGMLDRVVSIFDPLSTNMPPSGKLMIYICQDRQLTLAYELASNPGEGAPGIRYLQDLNADRTAELVESAPACGAATCVESAQILSWDGETFRNRLEGVSNDLAYPSISMTDDDEDGIVNLEVTASGAGSVGAGPQRTILRIWTYRPGTQNWVTEGDIPGASSYRIHILHDADTLASRGDLENAVRLYQQAATDITLLDWADPALEQANLGAYGRYRLVVLYTQLSQSPFADAVLNEMERLYLRSSPQGAYLELAQAFVEGYQQGGISSGCQAAREYSEAHEVEILDPLGPQAFGYGNREYTPQDVCEW
jgi:hypothetical protein